MIQDTKTSGSKKPAGCLPTSPGSPHADSRLSRTLTPSERKAFHALYPNCPTSLSHLSPSAIRQYTRILSHHPPHTAAPSSAQWDAYRDSTASQISNLPTNLKNPTRLPKLPQAYLVKLMQKVGLAIPPAAPLCKLHAPLNAQVIGDALVMVEAEIEDALPGVLRRINVRALPDELLTLAATLEDVMGARLLPHEFCHIYGRAPPPKWAKLPPGCDACLLAALGSDGPALVALHAVMLARMPPAVAQRSTRLQWAEAWLLAQASDATALLAQSHAHGAALRALACAASRHNKPISLAPYADDSVERQVQRRRHDAARAHDRELSVIEAYGCSWRGSEATATSAAYAAPPPPPPPPPPPLPPPSVVDSLPTDFTNWRPRSQWAALGGHGRVAGEQRRNTRPPVPPPLPPPPLSPSLAPTAETQQSAFIDWRPRSESAAPGRRCTAAGERNGTPPRVSLTPPSPLPSLAPTLETQPSHSTDTRPRSPWTALWARRRAQRGSAPRVSLTPPESLSTDFTNWRPRSQWAALGGRARGKVAAGSESGSR